MPLPPAAVRCLVPALVVLLASAPAGAGDLSLSANAFGSGYTLPLGNLAALLAFIGIGLWSGALGGGAVWQLPIIALAGALGGSLIAEGGIALPYADKALLLVPAVIGGMVALGVSLPLLSPSVIAAVAGAVEGWPLASAIHGPHVLPWTGFAAGALVAIAAGIGMVSMVVRWPIGLGVRALGTAISATAILLLLERL